jgi:hypothetical protein
MYYLSETEKLETRLSEYWIMIASVYIILM